MFLGSEISVCSVYHKTWTCSDIFVINNNKHARFDVLTVKTIGFRCVTLCSLLRIYWCFRGTCCIFLQGTELKQHVPVKCLYVSTVLQCNGSLKVEIFK